MFSVVYSVAEKSALYRHFLESIVAQIMTRRYKM